MLRSLFKELAGTDGRIGGSYPSLAPFHNRCNVLVVFEGSNDDRPFRQEEELVHHEQKLAERDVTVLRIAGGGVFQHYGEPHALNADDIRKELQGPADDEFEIVLVGRDGITKLRSYAPLPVNVIIDIIDRLPSSTL